MRMGGLTVSFDLAQGKSLHQCYGPSISLDCSAEGGAIQVESAVLGWSGDYVAGGTVCPETDPVCTVETLLPKHECNGRASCALNGSIINTDPFWGGDCGRPTNFIHVRYACLVRTCNEYL